MILRLDQMELAEPDSLKDNPFAKQLMEETRLSASKIEAFKGIYTSYSLFFLLGLPQDGTLPTLPLG